MNSDLQAINEFVNGKSETLAANIPQPYENIWTLRTFGAKNALTKVFAILLAHYSPVDLISGQKIDVAKALSWSNSKEFHHFFPREYLKHLKQPLDKINCLANFVFLTSLSNKAIGAKPPSEYLKQVEKAAGSNLESWLASNLISMDAYSAALKNDFDGFLKIRSATIHNALISLTDWPKNGENYEMPEVDESELS